jgi:hypothetical protein
MAAVVLTVLAGVWVSSVLLVALLATFALGTAEWLTNAGTEAASLGFSEINLGNLIASHTHTPTGREAPRERGEGAGSREQGAGVTLLCCAA